MAIAERFPRTFPPYPTEVHRAVGRENVTEKPGSAGGSTSAGAMDFLFARLPPLHRGEQRMRRGTFAAIGESGFRELAALHGLLREMRLQRTDSASTLLLRRNSVAETDEFAQDRAPKPVVL